MYQITPSGSSIPNPPTGGGTPIGTFELTVDDDGQVTTTSHTIQEVVTDKGTFYNASGDHQATAWRPVQPKVVQDVSSSLPVHGLLITGANYIKYANVNPVISIMKQEWQQDTPEEDICLNSAWPSFMATTNSLESNAGSKQALIVTPGHFRCTSGVGTAVRGVQRIYTDMSIELLRSASSDYNPPIIDEVDFSNNGDGTRSISILARDASGISKVSLLVDVNGTLFTIPNSVISRTGRHTIEIPSFINGTRITIQVVDNAGNVTHWTGKGASIHNIQVKAEKDIRLSNPEATQFSATIFDFAGLLDESESIFYRWEFGDSSFDFGKLATDGTESPGVIIDKQGNATFSVEHQYPDNRDFTATIKIFDAFGGIGTDKTRIKYCGDKADFANIPNIDLIACHATNPNANNISITISVAGGIVTSNLYEVYLDYEGTAGAGSEPDYVTDLELTYQNGVSSGLHSLVVTPLDVNGDGILETLQFDFDLNDIEFEGDKFNWLAEAYASSQRPVVIDYMPDEGYFNYTLN